MNSGSSTEPRPADATGLQAWHFYLLLSMGAAIWAVVVARDTHPAALLLISAAVVGTGVAAAALHYALAGFLGARVAPSGPALDPRGREALLTEKALVLRSLKELEFDHAMRKVGDGDFAAIGSRLRARALDLMRELDQAADDQPEAPATREGRTMAGADDGVPTPASGESRTAGGVFARVSAAERARPVCGACGVENDADARFCKQCGARFA